MGGRGRGFEGEEASKGRRLKGLRKLPVEFSVFGFGFLVLGFLVF